MSKLAILGGSPVRKGLFPAYNPIGHEEAAAVARVMESGNLSQYIGAWHPDFYGGPEVRSFEEAWKTAFNAGYALSVNSATSGLYAAVGACDVGPGDEVIVSPYTMSASATAAAAYGAVPVFADIDDENFCLSPESVASRITPLTKAIIVVHLFGHPADMDGIMAVARKHRLRVIEDCAQSPMSQYKGRYVGTIGDLGVFSLNYHKHIHTGEGGVVTTNDSELAERVALIRNHAEAVIENKGREDLAHLIGYNYRMTELQAAIGITQLKKLPDLLDQRRVNVDYLTDRLGGLAGLRFMTAASDCTHAYYVQAIRYNAKIAGMSRELFLNTLRAELPSAVLREKVPLVNAGYLKPLYLGPFYQRRSTPCAFNCPRYAGAASYDRGLCPMTEKMHFEELLTHEFMRPGMSRSDLDDVVDAFVKVWENKGEI